MSDFGPLFEAVSRQWLKKKVLDIENQFKNKQKTSIYCSLKWRNVFSCSVWWLCQTKAFSKCLENPPVSVSAEDWESAPPLALTAPKQFVTELNFRPHALLPPALRTARSYLLFTSHSADTNDCTGSDKTPIIKCSGDSAIGDLSNSDCLFCWSSKAQCLVQGGKRRRHKCQVLTAGPILSPTHWLIRRYFPDTLRMPLFGITTKLNRKTYSLRHALFLFSSRQSRALFLPPASWHLTHKDKLV